MPPEIHVTDNGAPAPEPDRELHNTVADLRERTARLEERTANYAEANPLAQQALEVATAARESAERALEAAERAAETAAAAPVQAAESVTDLRPDPPVLETPPAGQPDPGAAALDLDQGENQNRKKSFWERIF